MKFRLALAVYALANAILYSAMLPLWEGFDEPFHFGYVQHLATGKGLPDPRSSFLSAEIGDSLLIAPASRPVQQNLPQVATYSEYFASHPQVAVRTQLRQLPAGARGLDSRFLNYEAHHAPLAYTLLALPEWALSSVSLPTRILIIRMIAAVGGALLLLFGAEALFSALGLPDPYKSAALFCVLSCQMTWATIAHVANDWLAVPLAVWTLAAIARYARSQQIRYAVCAAVLLSLGLLTKAYFLALVPAVLALFLLRRQWKLLAAAAAILLVTAAPWYARNAVRYGAVSGMLESRAGTGPSDALAAAAEIHWPSVALKSARRALWTGNNSFTTFSSATLTALIALWSIALLLWTAGRHHAVERIVLGHGALYLAALAYMTAVGFRHTGEASVGPSPWFAQPLVAPMLGLAFLGCSRVHKAGRAVAVALVVFFGYILVATYVAKLIPLYGGYEGRGSMAALIDLYSQGRRAMVDNLDLVALAPSWIVLSLAALVTVFAATLTMLLVRSLLRPRTEME